MRLTKGRESAVPGPPGRTTTSPKPALGALAPFMGPIRKKRFCLSFPATRSWEGTSATSSCPRLSDRHSATRLHRAVRHQRIVLISTLLSASAFAAGLGLQVRKQVAQLLGL